METSDILRDIPSCAKCGYPVQLVRPGKHQCNYCEMEEAVQALGLEKSQLEGQLEGAHNILLDAGIERTDFLIQVKEIVSRMDGQRQLLEKSIHEKSNLTTRLHTACTSLAEFISPSDERRFQLTDTEMESVKWSMLVSDIVLLGKNRNSERKQKEIAEANVTKLQLQLSDAQAKVKELEGANAKTNYLKEQAEQQLADMQVKLRNEEKEHIITFGLLHDTQGLQSELAASQATITQLQTECLGMIEAIAGKIKWYQTNGHYPADQEIEAMLRQFLVLPLRNAKQYAERVKALERCYTAARLYCHNSSLPHWGKLTDAIAELEGLEAERKDSA